MQTSFGFPVPLSERYRPQSIGDFIGLDRAKRVLTALARNPFPSAWLFIGDSGTGKTTMALALAAAIGAEVHHIPSAECNLETIQSVRARCQYTPWPGFRMHMVLVDEADRMSPAAQLALLSHLDSTNFPPATIYVFTANDSSRLEVRFLSRLRRLDFSAAEMSDTRFLLAGIWKTECPAAAAPDFDAMLSDKINVRDALMRLETEMLCAA